VCYKYSKMVEYKCTECNKMFKQKTDYKRHLNRKTPCSSTNMSLNTKNNANNEQQNTAKNQQNTANEQQNTANKQYLI
jgi:DNA-directed RNA polymerase subunit RPC12/RpoP